MTSTSLSLLRRGGVAALALTLLAGSLVLSDDASAEAAPAASPPAALATPAAPTSTTAAVTGCRTTSDRHPWGEQPLRTWTPNNTQPGAGTVGNPGIAQGGPFSARLVSAHGRDTAISKEFVTLERADGCRRTYPAVSFGSADRDVIAKQRARHPSVADPQRYALFADPAFVTRAHLADGRAEVVETQHFAIWYGVDESAFSYRWQAERGIEWDAGVADLGRWMEQTWMESRDVAGAPMPYAGSTDKRKVNIYLCGTGLPFFSDTGDCGASAGSRSIFVSAVYILDGSSTMVHEFGHTLQEFTGGFTGALPGVGKIWEGHANWLSATLGSYFNIWYLQNLENGPTWQTNYYGTFPLLQQLHQDDDTRDLVWRAWQENLRTPDGQSREEFIETIVRLGEADGVYPAGYRTFADEIGWYGARLAASDFEQGGVLTDTTTYAQEGSRYVGLNVTDARSTYSSPAARPLWQFGTHLVPLTVDPGATSVRVTLTGQQKAVTAGWRYALVSVARDGTPSYSDLGAYTPTSIGSTVSLSPGGAATVFLAVSATPDGYERLGDRDQPEKAPTTFPYTVALDGAAPRLPGSGTCLGPYSAPDAANLNWNTNGRFTYDQRCAAIGPSVSVTRHPQGARVTAGASATFTAAATGREGMTSRWQVLEPTSARWVAVAGSAEQVTLPAGRPDGTLVRLLTRGADGALVASRTARLTVTPAPVATTTTLTVDRATQPHATSTPLTATARVTTATGATASGTVTFSRGTTTLPPVTLAGGVARTALPPTTPAGPHSLVATFTPTTPALSPSTSRAIPVTVTKATSSTTATSATKVVRGSRTPVTVTVTVPGVPAPTGGIDVTSAGKRIAGTTLSAAQKGRVTVSLPGFATPGTYTVTVRFSGSSDVSASASAPLRITVR